MNNAFEDLAAQAKWVARTVAKRRWLALAVSAVLAAASGAGITMLYSDRYEASAKVYVDTQTVLKPLMSGLTFQPDIDQQVRMLANTLISRPNVERLVNMPEMNLDLGGTDKERLITRLMGQIKVAPTVSGNLFEISYRDSSPERAQRLVNATVDMFVQASSVGKKRDSVDAGRFIEEQIVAYEAKLVEAENRLKDFKVRNFGTSGVSGQDYFTRMSVLTDQVNKLRVELGAAQQARDSYSRQLATEDPLLPVEVVRKTASPAVLEAEGRLEAQKKLLDDLLRRYTEAHPDVTSTRRTIGQLEMDLRLRREADERAQAKAGAAGLSGKAATSPIYQKLRISLAEADAQVASLRSQLGALQAQLDQARSSAGRMPQVEAELAQLNRDYDIIRKNYDTMVARRESASLGMKLDESSQLAEFKVVEPPRVSPSPVRPSRLHLALIAVVASLAGGIAVAVVADLMRPTFDDAVSLRQFSGRPVLGSLSTLVTPRRKLEQQMSAVRFTLILGVLMALQASWVVWVALNPRIV